MAVNLRIYTYGCCPLHGYRDAEDNWRPFAFVKMPRGDDPADRDAASGFTAKCPLKTCGYGILRSVGAKEQLEERPRVYTPEEIRAIIREETGHE